MRRRVIIAVCLISSALATAAEVTDATGHSITVPDHVQRVVAAGPSAGILLGAVVPEMMLGWPGPLSQQASALLLDGDLAKIPGAMRTPGRILHREERAEVLARFADAALALPAGGPQPGGLYARGSADDYAAAPGTDVTAVFTRPGWRVLAPEGHGRFRLVTVEAVAALDPDWLVFADRVMTHVLRTDPAWQRLRAVHSGHAVVAPSPPFGWVDKSPSINRPIGLGWLSGHHPALLTAVSSAVLYGRALTPAERDAVVSGTTII